MVRLHDITIIIIRSENMKPFSIAIDLDSTLNNLDEVWILQDYNRLYNDQLKYEDMKCWNVHEYVKPECGHKVYDILAQPGYFLNLGIKDRWTMQSFDYLYTHFDVYVVSSCHPNTVADKIAWMKQYFPQFDENRFIACHHKGLINTDYLIDDGPHNIKAFKQKSILVDAPYNQHLQEEQDNFKRVENWRDIRWYFEEVLREYEKNME
jgi:5'-nucleotidase